MTQNFKYSAFISYSHADHKIVRWLHRALERYRLPAHLSEVETPDGASTKKLKPFFRDRDDLAASTNLGNSVRQAMKQSEFLIVVCSPEAAKSKWVNKEILEFKKLHQKEKILCLIIDGEPNASLNKGGKEKECFPPALQKRTAGQKFEPIAADARSEGDGKRLAKLKLIAGILGIELDRLVQRDTQRHQKRQAGILVATAVGALVLSVLLIFAIEAKKEADEARFYAEEKRDQAEFLVEYMLEDLTQTIAQTERLEVMGDIAMQALGYYSALDVKDVNADILSRRSQILLTLAEIENQRGNLEQAQGIFNQAFLITEELLAQEPGNSLRLFDHSQSLFWLAALNLQRGNLDQAEAQFLLYSDYASRLVEIDPINLDWQFEVGYAHSNLGTLYYNQRKFIQSEKEFKAQLDIFKQLLDNDPTSSDLKYELAQSYSWYSDALLALGRLQEAIRYREWELEIYQNLLVQSPQNNFIKKETVITRQRLGLWNGMLGKIEAANEHYTIGISDGRDLSAFDPENTDTVAILVWLYLDHVEFLNPLKETDEINAYINEAKKLTQFLVTINKTNAEWAMLNYRTHLLTARDLIAAGQIAEATALAEPSNTALYALWQENPDNFNILRTIGLSTQILADGYELGNQSEKAIEVLKNYIGLAEPHENKLALRGQDFLARAWLRAGQEEKANEKYKFLKKVGYISPDFVLFWDKWGK